MSGHNHNYVDLTGMVFGRLTVVEYAYSDKNGTAMWLCKCSCGTQKVINGKNLRQGLSTSCGCYRKEYHRNRQFKDIAGMTFDYAEAIKVHSKRNNRFIWECRCRCGNLFYASAEELISGHTKSCGCLKSHSEFVIGEILRNNNISFCQQKRFDDCRDKNPLPFDFYIPSLNSVIEYDGELHYKKTTLGNDIESTQRHDAIKDKYCKDNNIRLLRIPYWEKDNIESILSDWLFLNEEERNEDDENICETTGGKA